MSIYESKFAQGIQPYTAGEQIKKNDIIKLNTNENPFPPSSNVSKVLEKFDAQSLRLYNDPNNTELKYEIAGLEAVEINNVFLANGSDEALAFCFPAFCNKSVAFSDVTYSFYEVWAKYNNLKINLLATNDNFQIDIKTLARARGDMLIICNPNAPTGQMLSIESIEKIVAAQSDKLVLIDEAYSDFCGFSAVSLTKKYSNLLVVKTLSKSFSLAGIRCGYAIGNSELIDVLVKIRNSFNSYTVNTITEEVAKVAIRDVDYMRMTAQAINSSRFIFVAAISRIGFKALPSAANFIFCTHETIPAVWLYEQLKERNILVRHFDKERIDNYLRITIGKAEEMAKVFSTLENLVNSYNA